MMKSNICHNDNKRISWKFIFNIWKLSLVFFIVGCKMSNDIKISKVPIDNQEQFIADNQGQINPSSVKNNVFKEERQKIYKEEILRHKIVKNENEYLINFYDENNIIIGSYDVLKNMPKIIPNHEKVIDNYPSVHYYFDNMSKSDIKKILPKEITGQLSEEKYIGRIDIYPVIENMGNNYTPILYQINAMEGYDEEYEIPASMGIINILDYKGDIWKTIRVINSNWGQTAVTQDGKYLVYKKGWPMQAPGVSFEVLDLEKDNVVYKFSVSTYYDLHGALLNDANNITLSITPPRVTKKDTSYIFKIDSKNKVVYKKEFALNLKKYGRKKIPSGYILTERANKKVDTILFEQHFEKISLK